MPLVLGGAATPFTLVSWLEICESHAQQGKGSKDVERGAVDTDRPAGVVDGARYQGSDPNPVLKPPDTTSASSAFSWREAGVHQKIPEAEARLLRG